MDKTNKQDNLDNNLQSLGTPGNVFFLNTPAPTADDVIKTKPYELYVGTTSNIFMKSGASVINDQKCFLKLTSMCEASGSLTYMSFVEPKEPSFKNNPNNTDIEVDDSKQSVRFNSYLNDSFWKINISLGELKASLDHEVSLTFQINILEEASEKPTIIPFSFDYKDKQILPSSNYTFYIKIAKSKPTSISVTYISNNQTNASIGTANSPNIITFEQLNYSQ